MNAEQQAEQTRTQASRCIELVAIYQQLVPKPSIPLNAYQHCVDGGCEFASGNFEQAEAKYRQALTEAQSVLGRYRDAIAPGWTEPEGEVTEAIALAAVRSNAVQSERVLGYMTALAMGNVAIRFTHNNKLSMIAGEFCRVGLVRESLLLSRVLTVQLRAAIIIGIEQLNPGSCGEALLNETATPEDVAVVRRSVHEQLAAILTRDPSRGPVDSGCRQPLMLSQLLEQIGNLPEALRQCRRALSALQDALQRAG